MTFHRRQPVGTPVGGQFATGARGESGVALGAAPAAAEDRSVERLIAWTRFMTPNQVAQLAYTYRPADAHRVSPTPWREQTEASRAGGRAWDAAWAAWESNPNITKRMVSNAGYAMPSLSGCVE